MYINELNPKVAEMIRENHHAYVLLTVIGLRANKAPGETYMHAKLGDLKNFGMTRGQYRSALKYLEKHGTISRPYHDHTTTTSPTVVKLEDTSLCAPYENHKNHTATKKKPSDDHTQATRAVKRYNTNTNKDLKDMSISRTKSTVCKEVNNGDITDPSALGSRLTADESHVPPVLPALALPHSTAGSISTKQHTAGNDNKPLTASPPVKRILLAFIVRRKRNTTGYIKRMMENEGNIKILTNALRGKGMTETKMIAILEQKMSQLEEVNNTKNKTISCCFGPIKLVAADSDLANKTDEELMDICKDIRDCYKKLFEEYSDYCSDIKLKTPKEYFYELAGSPEKSNGELL